MTDKTLFYIGLTLFVAFVLTALGANLTDLQWWRRAIFEQAPPQQRSIEQPPGLTLSDQLKALQNEAAKPAAKPSDLK